MRLHACAPWLGAVTITLLTTVATDADAWEAFCRDPAALQEDQAVSIQDPIGHYKNDLVVESICAPPTVPECTDGLGAARGWNTGEHRYLTETALRMIGLGLPDTSWEPGVLGRPDSASSFLLDYYQDGQPVDPSGSGNAYYRMTPAGPAGMHQPNADGLNAVSASPLTRAPWLAELSELPDTSYSLADYILGNETCLPPNALLRYRPDASGGVSLPQPSTLTTRDMINACHSFRTHMGALNSTHFGSQAAAMWFVHHRIALSIARRCKAMWTAAESTQGTAQYEHLRTDLVPACEREAFAFEAVGQHYMEDAWSSGHMWERWGSPTFEPTLEGQLRQSVTGAIAGMQHGWRYVAQRFTQGLSFADYKYGAVKALDAEAAQHDQLCLPGPPQTSWFTHPFAQWGASDDLTVKYSFLDNASSGGLFAPQPAGGDLYLLPCNALKANSTTWAVGGSSNVVPVIGDAGIGGKAPDMPAGNLVGQYQRMLTCGSFAFSEVYKAGPGTTPTYRPTQPVEVGPFDPALTDLRLMGFPTEFPSDTTADDGSLFHACFGQRATNHSMVLGSGVSDWGGFDSIATRTNVTTWLLPGTLAEKADLTNWVGNPLPGKRLPAASGKESLAALEVDIGKDLGNFTMMMAEYDRYNAGGIQSAQIGLGATSHYKTAISTFLGQQANQMGTGVIIGGNVAYLENPDTTKWSAAPSSAAANDDCSPHDDTYCPGTYPGTYCDRTHGYDKLVIPAAHYGDVPDTFGRCLPLEAAVLRGFRGAETAYWCANDTVDDMEAARATCQHAIVAAAASSPVDGLANQALEAGAAVPECDACAKMLVPHLRASCNSKAYAIVHDPRRRSTCDVLDDGKVAPLTGASLDKTALYAAYNPVSAAEALQAARYICAVSTKVPTDANPTPASPQGASFFRATGGTACFSTCDSCTTCYETPTSSQGGNIYYGTVGGPLEVHLSDPATQDATTYFPNGQKAFLFGAESDVIDIALTHNGMCAVRADKTVWCAGDNSAGQLGNGDPSVTAIVTPRQVPGLSNIQHIYVTGYSASTICALSTTGQAWCWGANENGEVGDGGMTDRFSPVPLAVAGSIAEIYGGCARTTDGGISCWNGQNMQGTGPRLPTAIPGVSGATQLGAGATYLAGNNVMEWIDPDGNTIPGCANTFTLGLTGFGPVVEIGFDGESEFCARTAAGDVGCWESGTEVGNGPMNPTCPGFQPPFTVKIAHAPYKATKLSLNTINVGGYGPLMFSRNGNLLTADGAVGADDTVSLKIPVLSANESPSSCP